MFHRFSTWWRALGVVLLSLATVPWPSAAQASATPTFKVLHQDVVATLTPRGTSHFSIIFGLSPSDPGARARVAIYPRVIERSLIDSIVSGVGVEGPATSVTSTFGLDCATKGPPKVTIGVYTTRPGPLRSRCARGTPRLHLACRGQRCDGVYPLRFTVTSRGVSATKWSLLVVQATRVAQPVKVDLIETLGPSSLIHAKRTVSVLAALERFGSSPMTLSADYRTLSGFAGTSSISASLRGSLVKALSSPLHQVVSAPPATVDFAGLAANGLPDQVREQLVLSSHLLRTLTGRYADAPVLLSGDPSLADVIALRRAGFGEIVLPEGALTVAPSSTLNWGAPFHPQGDQSSGALSTDGPLSSLVANASIEPGLRAALILATIDFLHFEAPYAPAVRTVVITAPVSETAVHFVTDLLSGFRHNPYLQLATLSPSFDSALYATNESPTVRALRSGTPSPWSSHNVTSLTSLIEGVASYSQAVTSSNVGNDLRVAVASAEVTGSPDRRQAAINAAGAALNSQLSNFRVDPSTITLAGPSTSLPITLFSRANYTVTAVVHLISDRLSFPQGRSVVVVMDSPTKSVRIPTGKHLATSLTLQVVVTTPDGQTVLARAAVQVRIAGTSIVGYFLTIASLLVLAFWWLRTYRRKPKGRHAR